MNYGTAEGPGTISLIADVPAVLLVKDDSPIHTVKDLLDLARKELGKLTFSSSGLGGTSASVRPIG